MSCQQLQPNRLIVEPIDCEQVIQCCIVPQSWQGDTKRPRQSALICVMTPCLFLLVPSKLRLKNSLDGSQPDNHRILEMGGWARTCAATASPLTSQLITTQQEQWIKLENDGFLPSSINNAATFIVYNSCCNLYTRFTSASCQESITKCPLQTHSSQDSQEAATKILDSLFAPAWQIYT